ncbi:MAG: metallopeptidase TldD-related protein [Thermoanaerobaculia bacterium]
MDLDPPLVSRWIEPLAKAPGEIADVFVERRAEVSLDWTDGELTNSRYARSEGLSARWRGAGAERIVSVSRADETGAREAIRNLQTALGRPALPVKVASASAASPHPLPAPDVERWRKRLAAALARHAPRHALRWTFRELQRDVIPAGAPPAAHTRRLISLEGTFIAASRRGDEKRRFSFHAPESDGTFDELKAALGAAAVPRERPVPCGSGDFDVVLGAGSAAVLFHEILSHPLESSDSILSALRDARLAVPDLEVRDEPLRLDLFGGYERDDEGTRPRAVKLLDSGRLAGRPTDRATAERGGSNGHARRAEHWDPPLVRGSNLLVSGGQVGTAEMARRLGNGLWIEEITGGTIELASGEFRLRFPRAQRVRRGRLADEVGPGVAAGDVLSALKRVEGGLGREVRPYRSLGWCARYGQVVPIQGAAPDVLIRQLALRPSAS